MNNHQLAPGGRGSPHVLVVLLAAAAGRDRRRPQGLKLPNKEDASMRSENVTEAETVATPEPQPVKAVDECVGTRAYGR
ncbi:hypothetical protein ACFYNW_24025 [Streptomyces virginiae]|uniref:hypothetical protein n=1 Tax=Streptomyces virginiae TaxID=1961 RepID=UPI0036EB50A8